jgi:hypothetical protein
MTASVKHSKRQDRFAEHDAGVAIASVWLILYVAMIVIMRTDHYPGAVIDVANATYN